MGTSSATVTCGPWQATPSTPGAWTRHRNVRMVSSSRPRLVADGRCCQLCFGLKTEIFISILVTQSHTLPPSVRRRSSTCLNFAPFWGSLRESTCRYPTLPTTPLEKVVKHSIIQVGIQYRLAKLLCKLPALLLYSFLVLGNGKSFIFKLFS